MKKLVVSLLLLYMCLIPSGALANCISSISLNASISGIWESNCTSTHRSERYAKYYTFTLSNSQEVTIDLQSSTDTYLFLLSGSGENGSVIESDDDGGSGYNSLIVRTLPAGTYTVEATTYSSGRTGSFGISVSTSSFGGNNYSFVLDSSLDGPEILSATDGDGIDYEWVALLVFPENLNQNHDFMVHIIVHDSYNIKLIMPLKPASEQLATAIHDAGSALIFSHSVTMATAAVGIIPLYGDVVSLAASTLVNAGTFVSDVNEATSEFYAQTEGARDLLLENPRYQKYVIWLRRDPSYSVPASFAPIRVNVYEIY